MRKICYLYFNAQEVILLEFWLFYCENFLFLNAGIDYNDIKNVYTIVIIEDSPSGFEKYKESYIHHGKVCFDTGLDMNMLQEYIFVNLDYFSERVIDIHTELEAWLAYLNAETVEDIQKIIDAFPYFQSIKEDVILYASRKPEEVQRAMLEYSVEMDENGFRNKLKRQEKELEQLQEQTRKANEEMQKANEEMQKANEEMQKANEEMQKANDEVQKLLDAQYTSIGNMLEDKMSEEQIQKYLNCSKEDIEKAKEYLEKQ